MISTIVIYALFLFLVAYLFYIYRSWQRLSPSHKVMLVLATVGWIILFLVALTDDGFVKIMFL